MGISRARKTHLTRRKSMGDNILSEGIIVIHFALNSQNFDGEKTREKLYVITKLYLIRSIAIVPLF